MSKLVTLTCALWAETLIGHTVLRVKAIYVRIYALPYMVLRAGYSTPFQTPTRSSSPLHCAVRTLQQLINDFKYSGTSLHSAGHHFNTTSFDSTKFETSINYLHIDSLTTTKLRVNSPRRVFDFTEILDFKSIFNFHQVLLALVQRPFASRTNSSPQVFIILASLSGIFSSSDSSIICVSYSSPTVLAQNNFDFHSKSWTKSPPLLILLV